MGYEMSITHLPPLTDAYGAPARVLSGLDAAKRHVELLAGSSDSELAIRLLPDSDKKLRGARNLTGALDKYLPEFAVAQRDGYGIFFVVNAGGHKNEDITEIRAVFVDSDGVSLASVAWHVLPDFIVYRNDTHWHAYWLVMDVPPERFREIQKRLAMRYGTDPTVCNPSRVLRLAGFVHLKNPQAPCDLCLIDLTGGHLGGYQRDLNGHTLSEIVAGLPDLPVEVERGPSTVSGMPVTLEQFREWLSYIDPTMKDDQGTWAGMALAIRYGELSIVSREEIDWEELLVAWCSGELWRARTGNESFDPSTYVGREELLNRVSKARKELQ